MLKENIEGHIIEQNKPPLKNANIATGFAGSKKNAEEAAAKKACKALTI